MGLKFTFKLLSVLLVVSRFKSVHAFEGIRSIEELNAYFELFFAASNSTTLEEWKSSLPTHQEKEEMRLLLTKLYHMNSFKELDSNFMESYKTLKMYLNVTVVQNNYCIIHEIVPMHMHRFPRMWGYTAIASKQWSRRPIHHSASHFDSDGQVCSQAAAVFERTRSRTLVIAGASRYAVVGNNPSECQKQFQVADASHNRKTMFHFVNMVMRDLAIEDLQEQWKEDSHFFIQWHGMAETSCLKSTVFLSTGMGSSSIYDKNIPATKLMISFNRLAAQLGMNANTPRQDQVCKLIAGTNIFGRYVNGVPQGSVCGIAAKQKHVHGRFVHLEQKKASRDNVTLWVAVIDDAYPLSFALKCSPAVAVMTATAFWLVVL